MDRCVKTGVGGLNGRGLLVGESSVMRMLSSLSYLTSRGLDLRSASDGGGLGQSIL